MAQDTEARATGSSAMIIAIVALVLIVLGAFAFYSMRPGDAPPTTVVTQPAPAVVEKETTVIQESAPAPAPDTVIIDKTAPATSGDAGTSKSE